LPDLNVKAVFSKAVNTAGTNAHTTLGEEDRISEKIHACVHGF